MQPTAMWGATWRVGTVAALLALVSAIALAPDQAVGKTITKEPKTESVEKSFQVAPGQTREIVVKCPRGFFATSGSFVRVESGELKIAIGMFAGAKVVSWNFRRDRVVVGVQNTGPEPVKIFVDLFCVSQKVRARDGDGGFFLGRFILATAPSRLVPLQTGPTRGG